MGDAKGHTNSSWRNEGTTTRKQPCAAIRRGVSWEYSSTSEIQFKNNNNKTVQ